MADIPPSQVEEHLLAKLKAVKDAAAFAAFEAAVQATPVASGNLRGNWLPGSPQAPSEPVDATGVSDSEVLDNIQEEIRMSRLEDTLVLVNNAPYASKLNQKHDMVGAAQSAFRSFQYVEQE